MSATDAASARPESPYLYSHEDARALTERLTFLTNVNPRAWLALFLLTGAGSLVLAAALFYTFVTGIGTWGNNIPVAWAFGITNFVWWIGIGHAGTFISAFLLLLEQRWRTSINRFAEAMTLFAVMQAGLFPLAHLGRAWFFYWLVPYPSVMSIWPQFRSALTWDIAAVSTYFIISFLFWYTGLIPDLAAARDIAKERWRQRVFGLFALGWRGAARHWRHYRIAYGLLAGLATPLVISVHSVVSLDFATAKMPGWHSTIFPPYFVAGAIFSGFAMVLTLLIPTRRIFKLHDVITERHLDAMAKMTLLTGLIVACTYGIEALLAWWTASPYESYTLLHSLPFGDFGWIYWITIACNVVVPQFLWWRRVRHSDVALFVVAILVNIGMWSERFIIIAGSLSRDFLPSSWHSYVPTVIDGSIFVGTLSFFAFLFLLFLRFVPAIPMSELKEMRHELDREATHGG